jgi:hypothetical protein
LFDRILPQDYLIPLKSPGPGYELLQAFALAMARTSTACGNLELGLFITTALGGARATSTVSFSRASATAGAGVVKAGTVVTSTNRGTDFVTVLDVSFGAMDLGPHEVDVQAVASGEEWNVPGPKVAANGDAIPGEIDTVKVPVQDPPYWDPTIVVSQVKDATGGITALLDQLGLDRGIARGLAERDGHYRARVRSLPDTVSPDAILRVVNDLLIQVDASFDMVEFWRIDFQTVWDGPQVAAGLYQPNLCTYDDPRPAYPFRNRWLDESLHRGAFAVVVPNLGALEDVGMAYDDTAMDDPAHVSPDDGGRRAHSAYDVPRDAETGILQGGYDGFDLPKQAVYKGVFDLLQRIKAAGVAALVELQGQ